MLQNKVNFFKKNGYVVVKNLLNKKEIKKIEKTLQRLEVKQKHSQGLFEPGVKKSLIHSLNSQTDIDFIKQKKEYKELAQKILNSKNVLTWGAKCNMKKKWHGSCEYYHQDFFYNKKDGFKTGNMITCAIFIDDHSHKNGGLWLFPKSHKKAYKHDKFLNVNSLQKYLVPTSVLKKLSKANPPISIKGKRGSCVFFHCKTVHGSAHNISSLDRKTLIYDICVKDDFEKITKKRAIIEKKDRKDFEKKELKKRLKNIA